MSLNRYEQRLYDYIESIPEENRYWVDRVKGIVAQSGRREEAALSLNSELWDYLEERSRHERSLEEAMGERSVRLSLLNLAEYLLRVWAPLPAKKNTRRTN